MPPESSDRLLPQIELDSDELSRGPWVFARSVREPREPVEPGALVEVIDASGRFVGHALFNPASDIRLRFLARGKKSELQRPREFLFRKLKAADDLRRKVLRIHETSDAYRLAHAEGDDLSGLIVDRLGEVLVCEYHALGFWRMREDVEAALGKLYPGFPVFHRVPTSAARAEGFEPAAEALATAGARDPSEMLSIHEHGLEFAVQPASGHKTGWFCDQRENRVRVARLSAGRDVLDLCTNGGGFALQAKSHGARRVVGVDLDEQVLARAVESARRSALEIEFVHADAFDFLRSLRGRGESAQVVVLDPHKLIPSKRDIEQGLRKYLDWNALALGCVRSGGILATFSCSGALEESAFVGMLFQAARRAERSIQFLEALGAGPDHPQRPEFSRSRYLKGALLAVQ